MSSKHIGYCLECGKSVFGSDETSFGGFAAWQANCSCILENITPFMQSSAHAYMFNEHAGDAAEAYDLVCKKILVLGSDILIFLMRKPSETVLIGHIEAK